MKTPDFWLRYLSVHREKIRSLRGMTPREIYIPWRPASRTATSHPCLRNAAHIWLYDSRTIRAEVVLDRYPATVMAP